MSKVECVQIDIFDMLSTFSPKVFLPEKHRNASGIVSEVMEVMQCAHTSINIDTYTYMSVCTLRCACREMHRHIEMCKDSCIHAHRDVQIDSCMQLGVYIIKLLDKD